MRFSSRIKLNGRINLNGFLLCVLFSISQTCLAEYVDLDPAFVVNLASEHEITFAQVSAQVRVASSEAAQAIETHNPAIRHAFVMLLSSKTPQEASTRQGKEALRTEAVEVIRNVMEEQHVKFTPIEKEDDESESEDANKTEQNENPPESPIQDVFFTRFIIQ